MHYLFSTANVTTTLIFVQSIGAILWPILSFSVLAHNNVKLLYYYAGIGCAYAKQRELLLYIDSSSSNNCGLGACFNPKCIRLGFERGLWVEYIDKMIIIGYNAFVV